MVSLMNGTHERYSGLFDAQYLRANAFHCYVVVETELQENALVRTLLHATGRLARSIGQCAKVGVLYRPASS